VLVQPSPLTIGHLGHLPHREFRLKRIHMALLGLCFLCLPLRGRSAQPHRTSESPLTPILARNVNSAGWVDYVGLRRNRPALKGFLESLRNVDVAKLPSDAARLTFWINAYNAVILDDVLEYVDGKTDSVKKVDGFFDKHKHAVATQQMTLDAIERRGREMHDPRIHFVINCASASCPKLSPFAYTADDLDRELNQAALQFFSDPVRGLRLDRSKNTIVLSPILKWYAGDFNGATSAGSQLLYYARAAISGEDILNFVEHHANQDVADYIQKNHPTVSYLEYDWTLNSQQIHSAIP
jgi:hypothetical protein